MTERGILENMSVLVAVAFTCNLPTWEAQFQKSVGSIPVGGNKCVDYVTTCISERGEELEKKTGNLLRPNNEPSFQVGLN